jgi:hypothetical protein
MPNPPAGFIWYELMTTDVAAAERFYASVVGWTPKPFGSPGGPEGGYTILHAGERGVAGIMRLPDEVAEAGGRPGWLGYIHAPDIDKAVAGIRAAGGHIHREPTPIPNVGRFAVVADPQGAMFMLLEPRGEDQGPASPSTPGQVGWHELYATDWEAAFRFYAGQFGWTKVHAVDLGPMGTYQLFSADGDAIGGMMNKPPHMPSPAWQYYFTVPAIDAAAERVREGGGHVMMGPHEVPGGSWIVHCTDPQGAIFALTAATR